MNALSSFPGPSRILSLTPSETVGEAERRHDLWHHFLNHHRGYLLLRQDPYNMLPEPPTNTSLPSPPMILSFPSLPDAPSLPANRTILSLPPLPQTELVLSSPIILSPRLVPLHVVCTPAAQFMFAALAVFNGIKVVPPVLNAIIINVTPAARLFSNNIACSVVNQIKILE